jgi:hypothetical protein
MVDGGLIVISSVPAAEVSDPCVRLTTTHAAGTHDTDAEPEIVASLIFGCDAQPLSR